MMAMPVICMEQTGHNIKVLREKNGYTVKQLQDALGFKDPQAIYRWQWGKSLPSIDKLVALSTLFNVTIDSILVLEGAEDAVSVYRAFRYSAA